MIIGLLKEIKTGEERVALTPLEIETLAADGHIVLVQKDAGKAAGFPDQEYENAGATLVPAADIFERAQLITKVKEIDSAEYDLLRDGQIFFSCLHPAANREETDVLLEKKVTGIAAEDTHQFGSPNCEVAGKLGAMMGMQYLLAPNGGVGKLATGIGGVPSTNALVLGAGIVGKSATKVLSAMGLGVTLLDINIQTLREVDLIFPKNVNTALSHQNTIKVLLPSVDLVINCVKWLKTRTDHLITREMLQLMRPKSVIVDISADVGGAIETYRPTTWSNPVYEVDGIIHFGVDNIPAAVPNTASIAFAAAILPRLRSIANLGIENALAKDRYLRRGLVSHDGKLFHAETAAVQKRELKKSTFTPS